MHQGTPPPALYSAPMGRAAVLLLLLAAPAAAQAPALRITLPLDAPVRLDGRAWAELGAVALTGVGHLAASAAGASDVFIPTALVGWGGYVGYRAATEPGFAADLGFTRRGLGRATRRVLWMSAAAAAGMAAVGAAQGSLRAGPEMLPLLVLYPVWGVTQQMLVQGFVTRHLDAAGLPDAAVVPLAAVAFGAVHVPNVRLTAATTVMGAAFTGLYLADGNLWPLGAAHGALGALFYVWVLDREPLAEIFGGADR